jgi:hypothetical protein
METVPMYTIHKLKPDRNFYWLLLPVGSLLGGAFFGMLLGWDAFFYFMSAFFFGFAAYTLLTAARTHNLYFLIQVAYMGSLSLVVFFAPQVIDNRPATLSNMMRFLIILVIFTLVWLVIVFVNRKLKWRGRDILELAAYPVEDIGNGYTARPLPAGKVEFSPRQILEFAEFARRNLIAVPYIVKDKVVLVPIPADREFPFILGLKTDYSDETWVSFDMDGEVSVNISQRDYLSYRDPLAFDQLCASLSSLFVEFLDLHARGEGVRIMDRLDAVGVSVFS